MDLQELINQAALQLEIMQRGSKNSVAISIRFKTLANGKQATIYFKFKCPVGTDILSTDEWAELMSEIAKIADKKTSAKIIYGRTMNKTTPRDFKTAVSDFGLLNKASIEVIMQKTFPLNEINKLEMPLGWQVENSTTGYHLK